MKNTISTKLSMTLAALLITVMISGCTEAKTTINTKTVGTEENNVADMIEALGRGSEWDVEEIKKDNEDTLKEADQKTAEADDEAAKTETAAKNITDKNSTEDAKEEVVLNKDNVQAFIDKKATTSEKENTNQTANNTASTGSTDSGKQNATANTNAGATADAGNTENTNTVASNNTTPPVTTTTTTTEAPAAHVHTWVDVTTTVNHPEVSHEEPIYEEQQVCVQQWYNEKIVTFEGQKCNQCDYKTTDPEDMGVHMIYNAHTCSLHTEYYYQLHEPVFETKNVQIGSQTVIDQAAWTETIVTGRVCSTCGATQ